MICPNCGAQLPDTAKMCFSCRMQFNANYKQQQRNAQVNEAQRELQEINKTGNAVYIVSIVINVLLLLFCLFAGFLIAAIVLVVILCFTIAGFVRATNRKAELEHFIAESRRRQ